MALLEPLIVTVRECEDGSRVCFCFVFWPFHISQKDVVPKVNVGGDAAIKTILRVKIILRYSGGDSYLGVSSTVCTVCISVNTM